MKKTRQTVAQTEPVGIVISSGDRREPVPTFSAYVWGPAPIDLQPATVKAA